MEEKQLKKQKDQQLRQIERRKNELSPRCWVLPLSLFLAFLSAKLYPAPGALKAAAEGRSQHTIWARSSRGPLHLRYRASPFNSAQHPAARAHTHTSQFIMLVRTLHWHPFISWRLSLTSATWKPDVLFSQDSLVFLASFRSFSPIMLVSVQSPQFSSRVNWFTCPG